MHKAILVTLLAIVSSSAIAGNAEAGSPVMVRIPGRNYEVGKTEVTQAEWRAVMETNPSHFNNCGDTCPVEKVSWNDAQEFIQKLNAKTGKQYRLPTGAEWEYACRGGIQSEYCGGNDLNAVAWTMGNSDSQIQPVGQKQANGYGLYDMTGNVWEWVNDCWQGECARRALRGGSWLNFPQLAHVVPRGRYATANRDDIGFRLARTLP